MNGSRQASRSWTAAGSTLDFGRGRRIYSEAQRQEISTRLPHCVVEGCTVPIRDCEIHHEDAWEAGGRADVRAGAPLCRRRHHPLLTEGGYVLTPRISGLFELSRAGP